MRSLLSLIPLLLASSAVAQSYTIEDLGTLSATPSDEVIARGINNRGHVLGQNRKTHPSGFGWQMRSFLWDGRQQNEIYPSTTGTTWAGGLNDADICVGQDTVSGNQNLGFIWDQGVIQSDIDLGPHHWTFQRKITADGIQGGDFYSDQTWGIVYQYHAYVRGPAGGWLDLESLADNRSFFRDMNDRAEVVGTSGGLTGGLLGFRWTYGTGMVDIGNLGGDHCDPRVIDNFGRIAGESTDPAGRWRPFLFRGGIMVDIGTLGGEEGVALGLNDFRIGVGASDNLNQVRRATLWEGGNIYDLNTLIPPGTGWDLTGAQDINELGEICGSGYLLGVQRAYRLTPVVAAPRMSGFQPGFGGRDNTIFGLGFAPGAAVQVYCGLTPGSTTVPCGATVDIASAFLLGTVQADPNGRIEGTLFLPSIASGLAPLLQSVEPATSRVGELVKQPIQ
jgi:probable HAF family extracellular repeat protein